MQWMRYGRSVSLETIMPENVLAFLFFLLFFCFFSFFLRSLLLTVDDRDATITELRAPAHTHRSFRVLERKTLAVHRRSELNASQILLLLATISHTRFKHAHHFASFTFFVPFFFVSFESSSCSASLLVVVVVFDSCEWTRSMWRRRSSPWQRWRWWCVLAHNSQSSSHHLRLIYLNRRNDAKR